MTNVHEPELTSEDEHHLRRVLRASEEEEIVVTDGKGSWSIARLSTNAVERLTPVMFDPPPGATTLYMVPLKGDRSEWVVAKATELGLARIVPLLSEHQIVKFKGEVRAKILRRWRRIADESAGQCRRTHDLIIDEPVAVADVPNDVAVAEFDGSGDWNGVRSVAVGPEGGWAPREWSSSRRFVSLGPTVLRAETAGVVAASIVAFSAGAWGFTAGTGRNG